MTRDNPENDIIKKKYFIDMNLDGYNQKTIDAARQAIDRFEIQTAFESFTKITSRTLEKFRKELLKTKNKKGENLSLSTIDHTLKPLQRFFKWLRREDGYKKKFKSVDLRHLDLTREEKRKIQTPNKFKDYYSIDEVKRALNFNPQNDVEMCDRAMTAMLACTAMRHESIITIKIGHIDLRKEAAMQDPRTMNTKNDTFINSKLIPIQESFVQIIMDWVKYLKEELGCTDNDPLFPKELLEHDKHKQFSTATKLTKEHIESHNVVPKRVKRIFANVGLPYKNPHSFRDMQVNYFINNYSLKEALALSMNLGHKNLLITLGNYGQLTPEQQFDILSNLGKPDSKTQGIPTEMMEFMNKFMEKERRAEKECY